MFEKDNKFPIWNQTDDGDSVEDGKKKTSLIPLGWKIQKS